MTQTGTPEASSGRGAPKVGPLSELSPVVPLPSHSVSEVPSQLLRQYLRVEPWMIGKLCELPVHPLSRSLPVDGTWRVIWFGRFAPSLRGAHTVPPPPPGVPGGTHWTVRAFRKPFDLSWSTTFFEGFNFLSGLLVFFGTRLSARPMLAVAHVPAAGGTKPRTTLRFGTPPISDLNLSAPVIGGGVGQLSLVWPTQAVRLMLQVPFGCPSVSHVGSPSVQVSVAPFGLGVAVAVDVSQIAAQLPPLPATIVACACGSTEREKASASAVLGRLILIRGLLRRRAPRAPDCWDRFGTTSAIFCEKTRG